MTDQRTPEWFEARKGRVTGSIVGAILGNAPYMTREQAMRSLVRDALGAEREFTGNVATEWGTHNEDGALFDFQLETGLIVKPAPFIKYDDWAGASPDGFVSDGALIEIKCPYGIKDKPAPVPFKLIPELSQPHYYDQMQFQMYVSGVDKCHFWQWTPHGTSHEIIDANQDWRDENLPILRQFYAEFLYELENNADEYLGELRVNIDTPKASKMVEEYDDIAEQLELLAERKKELLDEMVDMAGSKDACIAGRKLTLVEKSGAISYAKAVKELCPKADLEKWRGKPSSFWKFS